MTAPATASLFAKARDEARLQPSFNDRSGARFDAMMASLGYVVADQSLEPWLENMATSHGRLRAEIERAVSGWAAPDTNQHQED